MENATYTQITRQSGLAAEMRAIANNIANSNTTGFRAEGVTFAEHVSALRDQHPSLSMAVAEVRETVMTQGTMEMTGGPFDLAIEGEGFFMIETPNGQRLTRAGHFTPNQQGDLVTADGFRVLDAGGAPVFIPQGVGQVGLFVPNDPIGLLREDGTMFRADAGATQAPDARMLQGFLESSNVNPILEIARMIEVQRAYELGQSFLTNEDERIMGAVRALGRSS